MTITSLEGPANLTEKLHEEKRFLKAFCKNFVKKIGFFKNKNSFFSFPVILAVSRQGGV